MDTLSRVRELTGFLRNLYGDRKVSLARATITDRGKTTQMFHEGSGRLKPWSMSIENHAHNMVKKSDADNRTEVFYAPTPMSGNMGRKKEQALPSHVVYGDADEGLTPDAKAKLIELGACLVLSGGKTPAGPKYHVYLLLTREVEPHELERLNRALKTFIRGDKFDATTLLRLPGTRNHKYPTSPLVRVERLADAHHTPENLAKFLGVGDSDPTHSNALSTRTKLTLPQAPKGFNWLDNKPGYARMRKVMRDWDQRFDDPHQEVRRYMAAIAIVKDAIKYGVDIDTAYAFADRCKPLVDKAEGENGYSIQKDIAKIWRRETGMKPSGTLTADDIVSTPQAPDVKDRPRTTPLTFTGEAAPHGVDLGANFPFFIPNLDELLAGEYKPLEPTMVPCGTFHLLYAGKSHSLVADRSVGKTLIAIAMVLEIMKSGGRVAYFDFEDSPDTFIRDRMMNQYGITAEMVKNQFLYVGGTVAELDVMEIDQGTEYLAEQIKDWDLVIIDGVSASMGDLDGEADGNKDVDYKKWHKVMVQPFLDQGLATLQLDHSTKTAPRAGGTMQKGAKLTGVEYQVRVDGPNGFTMGRTGKVIIEAVKDRVGRISKHRRTNPPIGHDSKADWPWNDIATFTLASDDDGKITQAEFEPINHQDAKKGEQKKTLRPLTEHETRALEILRDYGQPMTRYSLRKAGKFNGQACTDLVKELISRGLIETDPSNKLVPIQGMVLDFSRVNDKKTPKGAKSRVECVNCGDVHTWPDEFALPDDIGYIPGVRLCKPCASEGIPRDGAEWARRLRENIDSNDDAHEDS